MAMVSPEGGKDPFERPSSTLVIASGLAKWYEAEHRSSMTDRNNFLNDLDVMRKSMSLPYGDPSNMLAGKVEGHLGRLPLWLEGFSYDPADDYQTGKIFHALNMAVAGAYKTECYFTASDQQDFLRRKLRPGGIGINLTQTVGDRLRRQFVEYPSIDGFSEGRITLADFKQRTGQTISLAHTALKHICERAETGEDFGKESSSAVHTYKAMQQDWVELTTDFVVFSAKTRSGNLRAVPMLEAKPISDEPQVFYPFRDAA